MKQQTYSSRQPMPQLEHLQQRPKLRPLSAAMACVLGGVLGCTLISTGAMAQTLPTGGTVVNGQATIGNPNAGSLTITQISNRAVIHWGDFSIGQGGTVTFDQRAGLDSITLNRVMGVGAGASGTGGRPPIRSVIDGNLNAQGRVFIINSAGVAFGRSSQVNVGGLVASTLDLVGASPEARNSAFMAGGEKFVFDANGTPNGGTVSNDGSIRATGTNGRGGLVSLIAPVVVNSGVIRADGGTVALGSAERVELDVGGDGLTRLIVGGGRSTLMENYVDVTGSISADGGRISLQTAGSASGKDPGIIVRDGQVLQANTMFERNGEIVLDSHASVGGVRIDNASLTARGDAAGAKGGSIDVRGYRVLVDSGRGASTLDVSGNAGGGTIQLRANRAVDTANLGNPDTYGNLSIDSGSTMRADALTNGAGGNVQALAEGSLRAYGTFSARGGSGGGNGGLVETSANWGAPVTAPDPTPRVAGLDVRGIHVDASARNSSGKAGTWLIDPENVSIVHGSTQGTPPVNGFDPVTGSNVQDGDINRVLNTGTNVTVSTPPAGSGNGNVRFGTGVVLERTQGLAPVTLTVNAAGNITQQEGPIIIRSTTNGALNVALNAGQNASGSAGLIALRGDILTQGGTVNMSTTSAAQPAGVIVLRDTRIDTRVGQSNQGAGGAVNLQSGAVALEGSRVSTSSGNVSFVGAGGAGAGVVLRGSAVDTSSGNIAVRGHALARSTDSYLLSVGLAGAAGVDVDSGSSFTTAAGGHVEVTGSNVGSEAGVLLGAGRAPSATPAIQSSGNVVLRAGNDGSGDALVIERGVRSAGVLNVRAGSVNTSGQGVDATSASITLGGPSANGVSVSGDEFARLSAPQIVVGSNRYAGAIVVAGALTTPGGLTLQSEGSGGSIALNGAVNAAQLGLLAAGDITQTAAAPVTAQTLLARSSGGGVLLDRASNNVSSSTLGGSAAGAFRYQDVDALRIGAVTVTGYDAGSEAAQNVTSGTLSGNTVMVRTLSQDLTLATNVSSMAGADLVAAGRFQNAGANTVGGAPWRIWADTWNGETRGGVSGSGSAPNLYGCAYGSNCSLSVSAADNHFIYRQQPVATVTIADASRMMGRPNPAFPYKVDGLILGDSASAVTGTPQTSATAQSAPGNYPITGSFTSPVGYRVNVVPGNLSVGYLPVLIKPDIVRDEPNTYTFDRNLGNAAICLASGPLAGDRARQGEDLLASEWSSVRSRPRITSCIDTERRAGCGDF